MRNELVGDSDSEAAGRGSLEVKRAVAGGGVIDESSVGFIVVVGRGKERSDCDKRENRVEKRLRKKEVLMAKLEEILIGERRDFLTDVKRIRSAN